MRIESLHRFIRKRLKLNRNNINFEIRLFITITLLQDPVGDGNKYTLSNTLQEIALGQSPNTGCANGFTFFTFMRNKKPPMKPPLVWLRKHSIVTVSVEIRISLSMFMFLNIPQLAPES
jgi:hypothetical protein